MSEEKPNYTARKKTIFRAVKDKDNPFVMIDRRPIENPALSWKAKGILAYLLSRPDNWIVQLGDLIKRSPDGVHAVRAAVRELTKAGHITRTAEREKGRFLRYVLSVHEVPLTGFPQADKPHTDNHTLNDTDSFNENELNGTDVPEDFPLDWKLAAGGKVSLTDEFTAKARDAANWIDHQCLGGGELAYAFMTTRKILIPESKVKGNRKAAREMLEMHVKPEHVKQAVLSLIEKNMTVTDLFSVSKTAISLATPLNSGIPQPVTVDEDGFPESY